MQVEVVELKKYFGKTKAVDGISFAFGSGQIFGFVGPNGAGKTTTMRIMATLDEPTAGDIFLNGISVVQDPEKARAAIGYMPDALPAHRDITVHDYIDFFARAYGLKGNSRKSLVEQVEEFTNLSGLRDKFINALSKGMKQRVSLARALVHDPPILVLDEPAAGLDPRARIELRELLKILAARGKAILVSSHILSELAEICDGTVIIEKGRILKAGTLAEITAQPVKRCTVQIRASCEGKDLFREIQLIPAVAAARQTRHGVEVDIDGDEEMCGSVIASLVTAGFKIVEFKHVKADLEDVFMNVTKGEVS
jgi:ABC-2 type transport system ATP-binding protein